MLRSSDIHASVGAGWPAVLAQLGIADTYLRRKAGPCPACGGTDRFVFDNRRGRGDFFCRHCGPGDGFNLLQKVHGWSFSQARSRVLEVTGRIEVDALELRMPVIDNREAIAQPTARVLKLRRESCAVADCPDAVAYLDSRGLWPLPARCTLRAHPGVAYFADGQLVDRFPALIADVRDIEGALVTVHVTYMRDGRKLADRETRKLLSPLVGRVGCAVQLLPATATLGVAEGLEDALAAHALNGVPVWAALNAGQLGKFEPPVCVERLIVYADRDDAGMVAAMKLQERMQGRVTTSVQLPARGKDFADQLADSRNGMHS